MADVQQAVSGIADSPSGTCLSFRATEESQSFDPERATKFGTRCTGVRFIRNVAPHRMCRNGKQGVLQRSLPANHAGRPVCHLSEPFCKVASSLVDVCRSRPLASRLTCSGDFPPSSTNKIQCKTFCHIDSNCTLPVTGPLAMHVGSPGSQKPSFGD